eukprot:118649-Amphidinium_carterae.1
MMILILILILPVFALGCDWNPPRSADDDDDEEDDDEDDDDNNEKRHQVWPWGAINLPKAGK